MPAGLDVTVPAPLPALVTVSGNSRSRNVAVIVALEMIVIVHVPAPVQPPPDQPPKVEFVAGVAVSLTTWPKLKGPRQPGPQPLPGGSDVTVPLPLQIGRASCRERV